MSECVVWTGTFHEGYPMRGALRAHRAAYAENVGEIPPGHVVHHTCDNKACVNPAHLAIMTPREHMLLHRSWERSHAKFREQTHCKHGHPLDGVKTVYGKPRRYCRTCHNADLRRRYHRRRLESLLPKSSASQVAAAWDETPAEPLEDGLAMLPESAAEATEADAEA